MNENGYYEQCHAHNFANSLQRVCATWFDLILQVGRQLSWCRYASLPCCDCCRLFVYFKVEGEVQFR